MRALVDALHILTEAVARHGIELSAEERMAVVRALRMLPQAVTVETI